VDNSEAKILMGDLHNKTHFQAAKNFTIFGETSLVNFENISNEKKKQEKTTRQEIYDSEINLINEEDDNQISNKLNRVPRLKKSTNPKLKTVLNKTDSINRHEVKINTRNNYLESKFLLTDKSYGNMNTSIENSVNNLSTKPETVFTKTEVMPNKIYLNAEVDEDVYTSNPLLYNLVNQFAYKEEISDIQKLNYLKGLSEKNELPLKKPKKKIKINFIKKILETKRQQSKPIVKAIEEDRTSAMIRKNPIGFFQTYSENPQFFESLKNKGNLLFYNLYFSF
jgi:hypothetical protein